MSTGAGNPPSIFINSPFPAKKYVGSLFNNILYIDPEVPFRIPSGTPTISSAFIVVAWKKSPGFFAMNYP